MAGFKTDVQWPNEDQQRWAEGLQSYLEHAPNGGRLDGAHATVSGFSHTAGWKVPTTMTVQEDPWNALTCDATNSLFTVPEAWNAKTSGADDEFWIDVHILAEWDYTAASGQRATAGVKNGAAWYGINFCDATTAAIQTIVSGSRKFKVKANDTIECQVWHNHGSAIDVNVQFTVQRLGHHVP